ncbi:DUF3263 domain-containing protein [Rathayibacter sp. VKM Ac-2804]|uniref:DUF3263 domain-containing protein n=1 Tax=Rathayibacter sp. VKM Ac-2804 TaxID=2609257 RepID=UPI001FC93AE2|nr:DUF3263 domain-containing protein [Rathayibacter sp. VKM Ac-2804]
MSDLDVLEFARDYGLGAGDEDEIRRAFGSPARCYQRLARVLEDPAALAAEPMLVYRLRRLRDARSSARAARRLPRSAPCLLHERRVAPPAHSEKQPLSSGLLE